jgi:hypothetical protein
MTSVVLALIIGSLMIISQAAAQETPAKPTINVSHAKWQGEFYPPWLTPAYKALEAHGAELMKIDGAVHAEVRFYDEMEKPEIVVLTKDEPSTSTLNSAPTQVDGYPVVVEQDRPNWDE